MNFNQSFDYEFIKIKENVEKIYYGDLLYYVSDFLDLAKQYHLSNLIKKMHLNLMYFNIDDERKIAYIFKNFIEVENPIGYIDILSNEELKHNEIMGSILNIGLKREVIGDIYCKNKIYRIAVIKSFIPYIKKELHYVSNKKIKVEETFEKLLKNEHRIEKVVVSSMRLDNIVSSIFNISREKAKEAINNKEVFLNFTNELKIDQKVNFESYLSLRRKGKVFIKELFGKTKKDNLIILIEYF